jgi:hypothetical protein
VPAAVTLQHWLYEEEPTVAKKAAAKKAAAKKPAAKKAAAKKKK